MQARTGELYLTFDEDRQRAEAIAADQQARALPHYRQRSCAPWHRGPAVAQQGRAALRYARCSSSTTTSSTSASGVSKVSASIRSGQNSRS